MMSKEYLGDSVYVEVENGMFKLTTDNGLGPSNTIYLELSVWGNLKEYAVRAIRRAREEAEAAAREGE